MTAAVDPRYAERPWKGIHAFVLEEAGVTIDHRGNIRIPYRFPDGRTFRERIYPLAGGAGWWGDLSPDAEQEAGGRLLPLGLETLPSPEKAARSACIIFEGCSDTLAGREAFAETRPDSPILAYYPVGLPGASTWKRRWARYFEPFRLIYLVGDGDVAGRRMIDDVHADLPWARPVWLPDGEDARSILQTQGPGALDPYLDRADEVAKLCVAFAVAESYDEFVRLLGGKAVVKRAHA